MTQNTATHSSEPMKTISVFAQCPNCGAAWQTRQVFLEDPDVNIIGYQAHFEELTAGLFLFNHSCGGTFSLQVDAFRDMYGGPVFTKRLTGTDSCPGHCVHKHSLESCPAKCECAFVRDIIQKLRR